MSASRVPFDVERHHKRRPRRWPYFAVGLLLGFVAGAYFILAGLDRTWGY